MMDLGRETSSGKGRCACMYEAVVIADASVFYMCAEYMYLDGSY
jgi:hypothetical protein